MLKEVRGVVLYKYHEEIQHLVSQAERFYQFLETRKMQHADSIVEQYKKRCRELLPVIENVEAAIYKLSKSQIDTVFGQEEIKIVPYYCCVLSNECAEWLLCDKDDEEWWLKPYMQDYYWEIDEFNMDEKILERDELENSLEYLLQACNKVRVSPEDDCR